MIGLPLLRSPQQLRSRVKSWRAFGETVALVNLRGAPHEGHVTLVREAQREADRVLVALLPPDGPLDEGEAPDDPSPHERAAASLMDEAGADALYAPSRKVFRPEGFASRVHVAGLADVLEGEEGAEALDAFAADMIRLFAQAQPDVAVFCAMAWQRRLIAERVAKDFDLCPKVITAEPERDDEGVPICLSAPAARPNAARLWRELRRAAAAIASGADAEATLDAAADALAESGAEVEYLDLRDAVTLDELEGPAAGRPARIFAAIEIDGARLNDNVAV
jgi:pantoate--beta-alanine ligase